jgi:hypothetical protein
MKLYGPEITKFCSYQLSDTEDDTCRLHFFHRKNLTAQYRNLSCFYIYLFITHLTYFLNTAVNKILAHYFHI